eukprot:4641289-Heterocapsa_arctica.AAC.1
MRGELRSISSISSSVERFTTTDITDLLTFLIQCFAWVLEPNFVRVREPDVSVYEKSLLA